MKTLLSGNRFHLFVSRNYGCNWPYNCIDWEKAANELKQDYSTVDFEGETYYYWA